MQQKELLKKMIELNTSTLNTSFNAMAMVQDQFEIVTRTVLDQASWMPADGRKTMDGWVKAYKTGRDHFKEYLNDSCKQVEKLLD